MLLHISSAMEVPMQHKSCVDFPPFPRIVISWNVYFAGNIQLPRILRWQQWQEIWMSDNAETSTYKQYYRGICDGAGCSNTQQICDLLTFNAQSNLLCAMLNLVVSSLLASREESTGLWCQDFQMCRLQACHTWLVTSHIEFTTHWLSSL